MFRRGDAQDTDRKEVQRVHLRLIAPQQVVGIKRETIPSGEDDGQEAGGSRTRPRHPGAHQRKGPGEEEGAHRHAHAGIPLAVAETAHESDQPRDQNAMFGLRDEKRLPIEKAAPQRNDEIDRSRFPFIPEGHGPAVTFEP